MSYSAFHREVKGEELQLQTAVSEKTSLRLKSASRSKGREGRNVWILGKGIPGSRNSQCKGPKVGYSLFLGPPLSCSKQQVHLHLA